MAWTNGLLAPFEACISPVLSPWVPTPAGYDATLPNLGLATTLMPIPGYAVPLLGTYMLGQFPLGTPARDPTVGVFIRDQGLVAQEVGGLPSPANYIEADALNGGIGDFVLGESHIDYTVPYHGSLP